MHACLFAQNKNKQTGKQAAWRRSQQPTVRSNQDHRAVKEVHAWLLRHQYAPNLWGSELVCPRGM